MSEILEHQPVGEFGTYQEVKVPDIPDAEINRSDDIEYFEKEGYVSDERFSGIMRMAHSEIGKILNNGKLSYERVKKTEDGFLGKFDDLNSNEELLAKVFFGIALTHINAAEREKGANYKEKNQSLKEKIEWKHWIENFVYENQNDPEIIEEFWKEYEATYNELPVLQKERKYGDDRNRKNNKYYSKEDNFRIDKSGILGEVAAMNLFNEISKEEKTKIKIEQASTKQDMNGIDLIVHFKNKSGKLKTIIVQVKCITRDRSNDENTVEFYSKFDSRNDKAQLLRKACFNYEREQRNSGKENISVSGGLWMEFTKVRNLPMIDNSGKIINEKTKNLVKDQIKLQLELN